MSNSLWMVEVKLGKVWQFALTGCSNTRHAARWWCRFMRRRNPNGEYRVRKYQRVEP